MLIRSQSSLVKNPIEMSSSLSVTGNGKRLLKDVSRHRRDYQDREGPFNQFLTNENWKAKSHSNNGWKNTVGQKPHIATLSCLCRMAWVPALSIRNVGSLHPMTSAYISGWNTSWDKPWVNPKIRSISSVNTNYWAKQLISKILKEGQTHWALPLWTPAPVSLETLTCSP